MHTDLLLIGAGPTGLGAAIRATELGLDWYLVEAGEGPGGMAGSVTDAHGFVWDLGGHVLHSHFTGFDQAVKDSGVELLHPLRNGWVYTRGRLVRAPIQHQLESLPVDTRPDAPAPDLAAYYRNHLGVELLESFFRPFTEKMWATPLERIDHAWTSLRNGSGERNVPALKIRDDVVPPPVTFPYPAGGTGRLWEAIAARLDPARIRYRSAVVALDLATRTATLSDGSAVTYTDCVSSMPLPALLRAAGREAPESLRANSTLVVGLGYEGDPPPALADVSWLYCPDPEIAWHRATVLSNYDPANAGPGRWSVLCEIGRSPDRVIADDAAVRSCVDTLTRLGAATPVSTWVRDVPLGYPVPTLRRDAVLRVLDARLRAAGIRSRGRFGGWRYESCNQDYSFAQGAQAVEAITHGTPEDVYWHPERY